ncbi:MAG: site-2 protease family protein [Clostridiales bacterium]|nr:site-2 protease family protein [Clostridiales bacterium]
MTEVKVHPGLFVVLAGAIILGVWRELLQAFLALSMHEAFHAVAAHTLGYEIDTIELLPFGGVARMRGQAASPRAAFIIAIAGPLCNFILAGGIAVAVHYAPMLQAPLSYFLTINLALALFNLLPALPLDGGCMLRAILMRAIRPRAATLVTAWIGAGCALALLGAGVYMAMRRVVNPFLIIMAPFLLLGALRELRRLPEVRLQAMLRRRDALRHGETLRARTVALRAGCSAGEALRALSGSRYTVIMVLGDDLSMIGQLDETSLLNGIARHGHDAALGKLL